ncbi:MAG: hypothetical protein ABSB87_09000 [Terriglobales bacterium]|jgi:hypothetical protein
MLRSGWWWSRLAFRVCPILSGANLLCAILCCAILSPTLSHASDKKKQLPAVRWTSGAAGCKFEATDDGHYRWTMTGQDLTIAVMMDSQELAKSRHRFYRLLGAYVSVTYTGAGKFEYPADVRIDFVRHHDVVEGYEDPTELSNRLQNDIDTKVFETERKIKKDPQSKEEKTALLREYEKVAAEFIEFVSTQGLDPNTVTLSPGNPEAHGWVFFATTNKWIGPWKEREDFLISIWMKDKVWQFPVSLPPNEGDLILRKPD